MNEMQSETIYGLIEAADHLPIYMSEVGPREVTIYLMSDDWEVVVTVDHQGVRVTPEFGVATTHCQAVLYEGWLAGARRLGGQIRAVLTGTRETQVEAILTLLREVYERMWEYVEGDPVRDTDSWRRAWRARVRRVCMETLRVMDALAAVRPLVVPYERIEAWVYRVLSALPRHSMLTRDEVGYDMNELEDEIRAVLLEDDQEVELAPTDPDALTQWIEARLDEPAQPGLLPERRLGPFEQGQEDALLALMAMGAGDS